MGSMVEEDSYAVRPRDLVATREVPLIGDAPDEELVERWSLALTVELDPDKVFVRSSNDR